MSEDSIMKRPDKYETLLLLLPVVKFIYDILDYLHQAIRVRLCDLTVDIHHFLLAEFLVIALLWIWRSGLWKAASVYGGLLAAALVVLSIKLYLIASQGIALDLIYFMRAFLSMTTALLPLLLLWPWTGRSRIVRLLCLIMANVILFVNIAFAVYYYYTGEPFESILFENLNLTSVRGFFLDISTGRIIGVGLLFVVVNLLLLRMCRSPKAPGRYYLRLGLFLGVVWGFYLLLGLGDRYVAGRICTRYGAARPAKNMIVAKISSDAVSSLLRAYVEQGRKERYGGAEGRKRKSYRLSRVEKQALEKLLQRDRIRSGRSSFTKRYDRIVFVVFESLSIDFFHYYNKKIPAESTAYFDMLLRRYFHLDRFYTSNMPTDYGLTALFKSRLDKDTRGESLFSVLHREGYLSVFLRGSTKYYGDHIVYYPKAFRYDRGIFREEMAGEYGRHYSGWGFDNRYVYRKALEVLRRNRSRKIILALKTIDFHLPGPKCDFRESELPKALRKEDELIKALYWIDRQLKFFIDSMKKSGLLDERTLIVITADHNPHPGVDFKRYALPGNFRRLARIPLIFITAKHDFARERSMRNRIFSQIDVAPTLLSIGGMKVPESFVGRNIFEDGNRSFALGKYKSSGYYRSDTEQLRVDLRECDKYHDPEKQALCKYINNAR